LVAVRVVLKAEGGTGGRRLGRAFVFLIGALLFVAGLLCAGILMWMVVVIAWNWADGTAPSSMKSNDIAVLAAFAGATLLALWLGLTLIRGRRRMGLYLRKFGFAESTRTVSKALRGSIGRAMRLVTLDDDQVTAIGAGRGRRLLAGLVWVAAAGLGAYLVYFLVGGGFRADEARNTADNLANSRGAAQTFGAAIGSAIINALILLTYVAMICLLGMFMIAGFRGYRAARRAERAAESALSQRHDVGRAARQLREVSKRILAPRLMVVRVPTAFWQEAIRGLAEVCDVVIIDVSQPTDALLWEVQNIKPLFDGRWILVGAADRIAPLADPDTARSGTPQGLLARLIDGEKVLAYGASRADRAEFGRALRYELAHQKRR
jgi:hypothetical protein